MSDEEPFCGAKIALVQDAHVLTYLRDDYAHIPYPAHWDLPGGGREGEETAEQCALRELLEEFGLSIEASRILWRRPYPNHAGTGLPNIFMAAHLEAGEVERIVFGDEGQRWALMPIAEFLSHDRAVPHLRERLRDFLDATNHVALAAEEGL
jgi:8-oxo-dGTP diphosphatase